MVIAGQLAGLVQSRVLSAASGEAAANLVVQNAWLIFMLPYSIIVLSIGTPYFTQLSEHAHAGRDDDVRGDIGRSIRTLGLFVVIATAALMVAAVPASRIFTDSAEQAVDAALVLICFLVGLVPLAVLFVIQRTFYAYDDTRTPFFFTLLQCALVVATALVASWTLPVELLAAGVALGQSLSSLVQVIVATFLLRRRLRRIAVRVWMLSLGRFALAAVPAGAAGWLTFVLLGRRRRMDGLGPAARRHRHAHHRHGVAPGLRRLPRAAARPGTRPCALDDGRGGMPRRADAADTVQVRGMPRGYHVLRHPEPSKEDARASGDHHRVGSGRLHGGDLRRPREPRRRSSSRARSRRAAS